MHTVAQKPMPSLTSACFRATGLALTCMQPDMALQPGGVCQRWCLGTIPASLLSTGLSTHHFVCARTSLSSLHMQCACLSFLHSFPCMLTSRGPQPHLCVVLAGSVSAGKPCGHATRLAGSLPQRRGFCTIRAVKPCTRMPLAHVHDAAQLPNRVCFACARERRSSQTASFDASTKPRFSTTFCDGAVLVHVRVLCVDGWMGGDVRGNF